MGDNTTEGEVQTDADRARQEVKAGNYTVTGVEFGSVARLHVSLDELDLDVSFVYDEQGVWDTEGEYWSNNYDELDFDVDDWRDDGENLVIPDSTGRYEHSFYLNRCELREDGSTVMTY